MSENAFENELARALARPDIDWLNKVVAEYHEWSARRGDEHDWSDELDAWFEADRDPDLALALIILSAAKYDDPQHLACVAAGLLENILKNPSVEILDRVTAEACRTARFRWMLDVPFRHAIPDPNVRAVVNQAVGNMSCDGPLPPRPWA